MLRDIAPGKIDRHPFDGVGQRGFALVLVLLVMGVVLSSLLFSYITPYARTINNDPITVAALALARDALVARAAVDNTIPGSLPCPDVDNDGQLTAVDQVAGNCTSFIGRLPWKTLGLPDLRDGGGERLWYALSANFRDNPAVSPLNSETAGQFTITGTNPASNVVAVVFAPGPTLSGQLRDAANQNNIANYLEGENANGDNTFITGAVTITSNDTLLAITNDVLFQAVEARVAREIRASLITYYAANNYFPYASKHNDAGFTCVPGLTRGRLAKPGIGGNYLIKDKFIPDDHLGCPAIANWGAFSLPSWFATNNWHYLTYYTVAAACIEATPNCAGAGFLTVVNTPAPNYDKRALIIIAGRALAGQTRPSINVSDYLEAGNATVPDDIYERNAMSATFNDKVTIVAP